MGALASSCPPPRPVGGRAAPILGTLPLSWGLFEPAAGFSCVWCVFNRLFPPSCSQHRDADGQRPGALLAHPAAGRPAVQVLAGREEHPATGQRAARGPAGSARLRCGRAPCGIPAALVVTGAMGSFPGLWIQVLQQCGGDAWLWFFLKAGVGVQVGSARACSSSSEG